MAVTGYGTIVSMEDITGGGVPLHPHDSALEVIHVTTANGATLTLGTDTDLVGRAAMVIPVSRKTTAPSSTAVSDLTAGTREKVFTLRGGADHHDLFVIGGVGLDVAGQNSSKKFNAFRLPQYGNAPRGAGNTGLIWEMVRTPMGGESPAVIKITAASSLQYIKRIAYGFAVEVATVAPTTTGGISVKEISSIDITFSAANGVTGDILCFIGGYGSGETVADDTGTLDSNDYYKDKVFRLPNVLDPHAMSGLICEIIDTAALNGASPATLDTAITASTDLQYIKHIEAVVPVSLHTSGLAVAWSGGVGATTNIFAANGSSSTVRCLVIGR